MNVNERGTSSFVLRCGSPDWGNSEELAVDAITTLREVSGPSSASHAHAVGFCQKHRAAHSPSQPAHVSFNRPPLVLIDWLSDRLRCG